MLDLAGVNSEGQVLEPCVGEGVFLDLLLEKNYENILAYEIDENLAQKYDFVKYESFVSAKIEDKFDLIIGNPPYIRWKNLEENLKIEVQENPLWQKYCNSLCDYLHIFILKSIDLLKENGQLIFICPEYWLNTTHSLNLRNFMVENGYFESIYQFKETPIFEKASLSSIVFKYIKSKKTKPKIKLSIYNSTKKLSIEILENLKNHTENFEINPFQKNQTWLLAEDKVKLAIENFEKFCQKETLLNDKDDLYRVGDFCEIGNGLVSGLDKAFQLNGQVLNEKEENAKLKVIKAKDLEPFFYKNITHYIFANDIETEEELVESYPNFHQKLQLFKAKLEKRYQYKQKIPYWKWVFLRNFNLFNSNEERIFVPCKERISHKNYFRFALTKEGLFPTQDVTALFKKSKTEENIEYILAFLNDPRVFLWLKYKGIVKGNIVEFSEKPLASIPFRKIDFNNPKEAKIHERITKFCQKYLETKTATDLEQITRNLNLLFIKNMTLIDFNKLKEELLGTQIPKPISGTLSGHSAGEPFDKIAYQKVKEELPNNTFRQFEFLNNLYKSSLDAKTYEERVKLINSPTMQFLLNRGKTVTKDWSETNLFKEKQNDTADILIIKDDFYEIIDVKTKNISKSSQAPNIISAYKLAQACAIMIDNEEYDIFTINYLGIDWELENDNLVCKNAYFVNLFKTNPKDLYINWAAAMQIQFHVSNLSQDFRESTELWVKSYLNHFVKQAEQRSQNMLNKFVKPFQKYL